MAKKYLLENQQVAMIGKQMSNSVIKRIRALALPEHASDRQGAVHMKASRSPEIP